MDFKDFSQHVLENFNQYMYDLIQPCQNEVEEAMLYSLEAGGKRIRPLLILATVKAFDKDVSAAYGAAAAIEWVHTYSLIHDDLPAIDNDDLRRGKPTNHKVFGEAVAILAGDALLTYSFGIIARLEHVSAEEKIRLIDLMSLSAGAEGMVGGQVLDIEGEEKKLELAELEQVHRLKTGALLTFSILAGAILGEATPEQMVAYSKFGEHVGIAFQIQDDILDVTGTSEELGKTAGKDESSEKSTYPSLLTLSGAQEKLDYHAAEAMAALQEVGGDQERLEQLTQLIVNRKN